MNPDICEAALERVPVSEVRKYGVREARHRNRVAKSVDTIRIRIESGDDAFLGPNIVMLANFLVFSSFQLDIFIVFYFYFIEIVLFL